MRKILIVTPKWDENNGGVIVLHKLCHIIKELGRDAFLVPYIDNYLISRNKIKSPLFKSLKGKLHSKWRKFKTNPALNTPVMQIQKHTLLDDSYIVIYPELVTGNPLNAKNVVRWFLHNPGFHSGTICFGQGELYFKFNSWIKDFELTGSKTSHNLLKVVHYPFEHYQNNLSNWTREGTAYCVRKGSHKLSLYPPPSNAIKIDGMSHSETSAVMKRVKTFISYDSYTAYSSFAVLCGCDSVVVPDLGISEELWYPEPHERYGLAWGFENIDKARLTAHKVAENLKLEEAYSKQRVEVALLEAEDFFDNKI